MATSPKPTPRRNVTLRHVLIFHRHGDRTPVLTSFGTAAAPLVDETAFWASKVATPEQLQVLLETAKPVGASALHPPVLCPSKASQHPYGLLTGQGVRAMTDKGRALRARYGALIDSSNIKREDVYVLSSSVPRTVESVQCLLRGFFHDSDTAQVPQFHVHTYEHNVLAPRHPRQVFNEIELLVNDDVLTLRSESEREATKQLALYLRECLGITSDQPLSWTAIRDALKCCAAHGRPFPDGIDQSIFLQVEAYDTWLWQRLYRGKDFCYRAFKDGVNEVYSFLKTVVEHKQPAKLSFFSAHDNSIVALLGALQIDAGTHLPEYGSMLALEMYEDEATHEFFITPRYDNEVVTFAGHEQDSLCPFVHFESLVLEFLSHTPAEQARAKH
ncbi:unnamed protein product [Hyaloperonospora brassicae]|uniref:Histidine acid phosphatase n=1 Tax=Hyaloperonospora brassicae TaxID=162125 RepID=A0AAV0UXU2_HYABA|nr:unnamed protein product [Hyaloperonospora brassicae]